MLFGHERVSHISLCLYLTWLVMVSTMNIWLAEGFLSGEKQTAQNTKLMETKDNVA
jgi:hypothetical protein